MNIEDGDETLLATGLPFAVAKAAAHEDDEVEHNEKGVGEERGEIVPGEV
jgi:hypothetical protein